MCKRCCTGTKGSTADQSLNKHKLVCQKTLATEANIMQLPVLVLRINATQTTNENKTANYDNYIVWLKHTKNNTKIEE